MIRIRKSRKPARGWLLLAGTAADALGELERQLHVNVGLEERTLDVANDLIEERLVDD